MEDRFRDNIYIFSIDHKTITSWGNGAVFYDSISVLTGTLISDLMFEV